MAISYTTKQIGFSLQFFFVIYRGKLYCLSCVVYFIKRIFVGGGNLLLLEVWKKTVGFLN